MSCIERIKLEQFVTGKLAPKQMLAVDSHIRECADCKKLAQSISSRVDLASAVTGAADCPEYEHLSAYLDESLDAARAKAIRTHANICEYCTNDLNRMSELRSHASLREKITVTPQASASPERGFFFYWRQTLAVASLAGLVAIALTFGNFGRVDNKDHQQIAVNPPINNSVKIMSPKKPPTPEPEKIASKPLPVPVRVTVNNPVRVAANYPKPPRIVTPPVLRDGRYSVVGKGDTLALIDAKGKSVASRLEARIASRIDEKLMTGKINLPESVKMAVAPIMVRDGETNAYTAPPAAPKPIGPIGRIVMSATPTFNWAAVDLAEAYRVRIYDEFGNMVAEQLTKNTRLAFSKPLARGKTYAWRVGVRFGEEDSYTQSGPAAFYVLSAQDFDSIKNVRTRLPGSHLALGAAYESAGLYEEAANEYRLLRRANPNSKLAKTLLDGVAQR